MYSDQCRVIPISRLVRRFPSSFAYPLRRGELIHESSFCSFSVQKMSFWPAGNERYRGHDASAVGVFDMCNTRGLSIHTTAPRHTMVRFRGRSSTDPLTLSYQQSLYLSLQRTTSIRESILTVPFSGRSLLLESTIQKPFGRNAFDRKHQATCCQVSAVISILSWSAIADRGRGRLQIRGHSQTSSAPQGGCRRHRPWLYCRHRPSSHLNHYHHPFPGVYFFWRRRSG